MFFSTTWNEQWKIGFFGLYSASYIPPCLVETIISNPFWELVGVCQNAGYSGYSESILIFMIWEASFVTFRKSAGHFQCFFPEGGGEAHHKSTKISWKSAVRSSSYHRIFVEILVRGESFWKKKTDVFKSRLKVFHTFGRRSQPLLTSWQLATWSNNNGKKQQFWWNYIGGPFFFVFFGMKLVYEVWITQFI